MMKQAIMCSALFFLYYLPIAGETSVIASKQNLRKILRMVQIIREFIRRSGLIHEIYLPISVFFFQRKKC